MRLCVGLIQGLEKKKTEPDGPFIVKTLKLQSGMDFLSLAISAILKLSNVNQEMKSVYNVNLLHFEDRYCHVL